MSLGYGENGMGLGWDGELDLIRDETTSVLSFLDDIQVELEKLGVDSRLVIEKINLSQEVLQEYIVEDLDGVISRILKEAVEIGARKQS